MTVHPLKPSQPNSAAKPVASVRSLAAQRDDTGLVQAVLRGDRGAAAELFDRHAPKVRRVLLRVLGSDPELADLLQEVFVHGLRDLHKLSEPAAVGGWLNSIAVNLARRTIRKRSRWRWLRPTAPEELAEVPDLGHDAAGTEELKAVYAVLSSMHADERIAFALRFVEGMELKEVAASCSVSLATIKRRLSRAEADFRERAEAHPVLAERAGRGSKEPA